MDMNQPRLIKRRTSRSNINLNKKGIKNGNICKF